MPDDVKVDSVRSVNTDTLGRTLNSARSNHFIIDSSSGPAEAVTSGEAFLAGISSCGVNVVNGAARQRNIALERVDVDIDGVRSAQNTADFLRIDVRFKLVGPTREQGQELVQHWQKV
ncbi:MAG: OsmC family protein [Chloroflexota bacterium]